MTGHACLAAALLWLAWSAAPPAGAPAEVIEVELVEASAASAPAPGVTVDLEPPQEPPGPVFTAADIDPAAVLVDLPPEAPEPVFELPPPAETPAAPPPPVLAVELPPEAPAPVFMLPKPAPAPLPVEPDSRLAQQQQQQQRAERERQQQQAIRQESLRQEKLRQEKLRQAKLAKEKLGKEKQRRDEALERQRAAQQKAARQQRAAERKAVQARNANQQASPGRTGQRGSSMSPAAYAAIVGARVRAAMSYPASARQRGATGVANVSFAISPAGAPTAVRIAGSSGHADLDAAALAAVRRARFPAPPSGASRSFTAPMRFNLR
ncbi:MAG: TonB family protein [Alphaproteobacteria bacterium]|nr:TonB family protein [Alphaproteobacteria bacterium]